MLYFAYVVKCPTWANFSRCFTSHGCQKLLIITIGWCHACYWSKIV